MRGLLVLVMLAGMAAQAFAGATLDRIRDTGVFRIGYRTDAKPYSYQTPDGRPAGFIVDLCTEVAGALGPNVRADYIAVPARERFEAVRDGRVDILCDPSSVTLARRELVDFSLPTFLDGAGVLSRANRPVMQFEDMAGKTVGVLAGTTTEATLRQAIETLRLDVMVVPVPDHRRGMDMVWSDKIDAYFADRGIIAAMLADGGRPGFVLSRRYFSYETYALALPRNDSEFRFLVDKTLARLYRTNKIKTLLTKAFGSAPIDDMVRVMFQINALPD